MKPKTKQTVRDLLSDFALAQLSKIRKRTLAEIRRSYPFHRLIFSESAILAARTERSVVTSMGSKLYPSLARIVALDKYTQVYPEYSVAGEVNDAASNMVEQIVTELRAPKRGNPNPRYPNHEDEIADILNSPGGGHSQRTVTADLYIGDYRPGPLFVELKTPLPNLDIAAESKKKILYYLLIMDRKGITGARGVMGFTYNPYGKRENYAHSITKRIMDMDYEVVMGEGLWDMLGGPGTYAELLDIIEEVRTELFYS